MKREVAIISVSSNGRITIPDEVRKELSICTKDKMKVEIQTESDKKIIILTRI